MRILYGVVGEGMGHAIRSRVVLDATLLVDGHQVAVREGELEPVPGLRLAPTAAAAEAAPPACGR
jgi:hypothetical protein